MNETHVQSLSPGVTFGFYDQPSTGATKYTQLDPNPGSYSQSHGLIFPLPDQVGKLHYIIAFEDLDNLGDKDYNDLVVDAVHLPVPGTLLLVGSGLVGLAA